MRKLAQLKCVHEGFASAAAVLLDRCNDDASTLDLFINRSTASLEDSNIRCQVIDAAVLCTQHHRLATPAWRVVCDARIDRQRVSEFSTPPSGNSCCALPTP